MTVKSNAELLNVMDAAFKDITEVSDLGNAVLQPEKAARFVREMQFRTRMIPEARFINMQAKQRDIDRIGFAGRIIRSGKDGAGAHRSLAENEYATPGFATNRLITNELIAIASLRDDTLRENIERGNLENTLLEIFGQASGRDFEEYALYADTAVAHATDDVLSKTDGWLKLAGNRIYGLSGTQAAPGGAGDFDEAATGAEGWPVNMFEAQLEALPKQFLDDPGEFRFYVPWEVENDYRTYLHVVRSSDLGDTGLVNAGGLRYKGIPVVQVPLMARAPVATAQEDGLINGRTSLLTVPSNLVWGVFHQVQIEPEREAKERRTDFVVTFEADAHYEDENAAVVALIDKSAG